MCVKISERSSHCYFRTRFFFLLSDSITHILIFFNMFSPIFIFIYTYCLTPPLSSPVRKAGLLQPCFIAGGCSSVSEGMDGWMDGWMERRAVLQEGSALLCLGMRQSACTQESRVTFVSELFQLRLLCSLLQLFVISQSIPLLSPSQHLGMDSPTPPPPPPPTSLHYHPYTTHTPTLTSPLTC